MSVVVLELVGLAELGFLLVVVVPVENLLVHYQLVGVLVQLRLVQRAVVLHLVAGLQRHRLPAHLLFFLVDFAGQGVLMAHVKSQLHFA